MRGNDETARFARADPEKASRNPLHVMREVLAGEIEEAERDDVLPADDRRRRESCPRSGARWIYDGWRSHVQGDTHLDAEPRGHALSDALHLVEHQSTRFRFDGTHGPGE